MMNNDSRAVSHANSYFCRIRIPRSEKFSFQNITGADCSSVAREIGFRTSIRTVKDVEYQYAKYNYYVGHQKCFCCLHFCCVDFLRRFCLHCEWSSIDQEVSIQTAVMVNVLKLL